MCDHLDRSVCAVLSPSVYFCDLSVFHLNSKSWWCSVPDKYWVIYSIRRSCKNVTSDLMWWFAAWIINILAHTAPIAPVILHSTVYTYRLYRLLSYDSSTALYKLHTTTQRSTHTYIQMTVYFVIINPTDLN